jgi:hypothetical protein
MYFDHSLMFISLYIVDVNDRQQAAIKQLEADTKNAMASVGRTFLNLKMMEPQSSITGDIIMEVSDDLLTCMVPQVAANPSPSQQ